MAFGKKRPQEPGQAAAPEEAMPTAGIEPPPDGLSPELFGGEAGGDAGATGLEAAAEAPVDPPVEAGASGEPEAPPATATGGGDDLLRMFQESQVESSDNAALLELAGDVAIDDLLEDLLTVASAMGIKTGVAA